MRSLVPADTVGDLWRDTESQKPVRFIGEQHPTAEYPHISGHSHPSIDINNGIPFLQELLTNLTTHAQKFLNQPISTVVITTPIFITQTQWTRYFVPAATLAGLNPIGALPPPISARTNAMEAAGSADGYMICDDYTYVPRCFEEIDSMPFEWIMAIEYSRAALSAVFSPSMDAPDSRNSFVDFELGASKINIEEEVEENHESQRLGNDDYWSRLRHRLQQLKKSASKENGSTGIIERLILFGENATNENFLLNVRDAFADFILPLPAITSPFSASSPASSSSSSAAVAKEAKTKAITALFYPSLGAAEIAKRAMEAPDACVEEEDCVARRKELAG